MCKSVHTFECDCVFVCVCWFRLYGSGIASDCIHFFVAYTAVILSSGKENVRPNLYGRGEKKNTSRPHLYGRDEKINTSRPNLYGHDEERVSQA